MAYTKRYSKSSTKNSSTKNRLSDRDMLLDLLSGEKAMSHMYDHAITESSNSMVRNTFEQLQHDEHQTAETLFESMQERGWYSNTGSRSNQSNVMQRDFDLEANSNYAVTSGAPGFGQRLGYGNSQRLSGNNRNRDANNTYDIQADYNNF